MTSKTSRQGITSKATVEPWTKEQRERLKSAIRAHSTIKAVAAEVPISRQWLTSILQDKETQSPSIRSFNRVCDVIGVRPEEIIHGAVVRAEQQAAIKQHGPTLAEDADWKNLAEIDITQFTETSEGPTLSLTPFRRDWLNKVLGAAKQVYLARLPVGYPPVGLIEDDMVFVQVAGERPLIDRAIYIWQRDMALFVARLGERRPGDHEAERFVSPSEIGRGDGEAQPMGRIIGVTMKRI